MHFFCKIQLSKFSLKIPKKIGDTQKQSVCGNLKNKFLIIPRVPANQNQI